MTKAAITHFALIRVGVCAEKHGHRGGDGFQLQKTSFGNSNNLEANESYEWQDSSMQETSYITPILFVPVANPTRPCCLIYIERETGWNWIRSLLFECLR
jgi:hypothetical protein